MPTMAERFVSLVNTLDGQFVHLETWTTIRKVDEPEGPCVYIYWMDGSGVAYDKAEGKAHILSE